MAKHDDNHLPLVEEAYSKIRYDLSAGIMKPGEKIIYKDLVERYQISETPIKQALNRMVMEGLIESIPYKGMQIKPISIQDYNQIMDIREMLEITFAPKILESVSFQPEQLDILEANIKKQLRAIEIGTTEANDFIEIYTIDHDFHRSFLKCANHTRALQVYDMIGAHVFSYFLYNKKPASKLLEGVKEHQVIVDALRNQDLDALYQAIHKHFIGARQSINYTMPASI